MDTPQAANPNDANNAFEGPWPTEDSNNTSVEDAFRQPRNNRNTGTGACTTVNA